MHSSGMLLASSINIRSHSPPWYRSMSFSFEQYPNSMVLPLMNVRSFFCSLYLANSRVSSRMGRIWFFSSSLYVARMISTFSPEYRRQFSTDHFRIIQLFPPPRAPPYAMYRFLRRITVSCFGFGFPKSHCTRLILCIPPASRSGTQRRCPPRALRLSPLLPGPASSAPAPPWPAPSGSSGPLS